MIEIACIVLIIINILTFYFLFGFIKRCVWLKGENSKLKVAIEDWLRQIKNLSNNK